MRSLKTKRVVAGTVLVLIAVAVVMVQTSRDSALAQQAKPAAAIPKLSSRYPVSAAP